MQAAIAKFQVERKKPKLFIPLLLLALAASFLVVLNIGAVQVSPVQFLGIILKKLGITSAIDFSTRQESVIWAIRLPRILLSIFTGAALGICGTAIQGLYRNPLADPSVIGISSGASVFAALFIVCVPGINIWLYSLGLPVMALFGGLIASLLVFRISAYRGKTDVPTLLLAGIAVNAMSAALTGIMVYLSDENQIRTITFWMMGSLAGASWLQVGIVTVVSIAACFYFVRHQKAFNLLSLGEREASHLGVHIESLKRGILFFTALAVGTSVAFCGVIGFVGLVIPHILRLILGPDHKTLFPASTIGSAIFLCWADTVSRTILAPEEIPIGIITALCGAPVFISLLMRQKKKIG